jgi:hypothetical protein
MMIKTLGWRPVNGQETESLTIRERIGISPWDFDNYFEIVPPGVDEFFSQDCIRRLAND